MYYYDGKYYLYYLITDHSPGEGFGVAVSSDGVHYVDYGKRLSASDKMVFYLGTGSVWKSANFNRDGWFICNYSEWRKDEASGANRQNILFARSKNLIDWEKLGDEFMFSIDSDRYVQNELDGGRWDCIYPVKTDYGYMGFFTATPKDYYGCGFATTEDGIHWTAQKPPQFDMADKNITEGIEAGAVCVRDGRYYMLMGTYVNDYGVAVMTCDSPNGIYTPQKKNFALLSNACFMHAYFMRIVQADGEWYVNHHVLMREKNQHDRHVTALAPLKRIVFDGDILRLAWAEINQALRGEKLPAADFDNGLMLETRIAPQGSLCFLTNGGSVDFSFDCSCGKLSIYENGVKKEQICRETVFPCGKVRFLYRDTLSEVYVDDHFVACYTFPDRIQSVKPCADGEHQFWRLTL